MLRPVLEMIDRSFEVERILVVNRNGGDRRVELGSAHPTKPVILRIGMVTLSTAHK